jgi:hypothetical protein
MSFVTFSAGQILTAAQLNTNFRLVRGMDQMIPTSVTVSGVGSSGSVSATGRVTFTTAATISVNGCFTSDFTNYLMVMDYDASGNDIEATLRLRVGGVDNSTANSYIFQTVTANATAVSGARTTTTSWRMALGDDDHTNGTTMIFYRPALADTTSYFTMETGSYLGGYLRVAAGTHNQNTAYDGFTVIPASGSYTGKLNVYGLWD